LSILALIRNLSDSIRYFDKKLSKEVEFETDNLAFDNNIGFIDAKEEEEEGPKKRKIRMNTPTDTKNMKYKIKNTLYNALLHYWDLFDGNALLACLLDPRFASEELNDELGYYFSLPEIHYKLGPFEW
ncbi:79_t:CDS:2, partial [Gigaspora rosea]